MNTDRLRGLARTAVLQGTARRRQPMREVRVPSRTRPGVEYRVLIGLDGKGICTCQGYDTHGHCEHARKGEEVWMTQQMPAIRDGGDASTALVPIKVEPRPSLLPSKSDLEIIGLLSRSVIGARGHAVPQALDTPAKAAAVMIAGLELGVRPMTALRHIFVVNGRTEPDAQIMAGIVAAAEPSSTIEVVDLSDVTCTMRIKRPLRSVDAEYTYTIDDARKANLIKPGNPWDKFPKDMLRWAATKRLCRAYAPDLINSVGVAVDDIAPQFDDDNAIDERVDAAPATDIASLPQSALYSEGDEPPQDAMPPYEAALKRVALAYYGGEEALAQAVQAADDQSSVYNIADLLLGDFQEWLTMYPDEEGIQHAEAVAAVVATMVTDGMELGAAVRATHTARAEAGLPFSAEVLDDVAADAQDAPATQPESPPAAATDAAPARGRRTAQQPLV